MFKQLKEYLLFHKQNLAAAKRKRQIASSLKLEEYQHLIPRLKLKSEWYGSAYGGFYILPQFLTDQSIIYSFGLGKDISFDRKCIERHSCSVFGFDPTPKSINWLAEQSTPKQFKSFPIGIGLKSGPASFFLPPDKGTSGSILKNDSLGISREVKVELKRLADIVQDLGHAKLDVLKMDIEGAEYDILPDILASGIVIDQILLEFHDRQFEGTEPPSKAVIEKLREAGYEIYASSMTFEEISLVRTELISKG